jgi:hypothetical protein
MSANGYKNGYISEAQECSGRTAPVRGWNAGPRLTFSLPYRLGIFIPDHSGNASTGSRVGTPVQGFRDVLGQVSEPTPAGIVIDCRPAVRVFSRLPFRTATDNP